MEGDFAVDPLFIENDVTRVLLQQGRVLLPADWNALNAVFAQQVRYLARDLIGRHGGPAGNVGFAITTKAAGIFEIGNGTYWVDGIRVSNRGAPKGVPFTYETQPYYKPADPIPKVNGLFYLDAWEQHVSAAEDEKLREVALGGPDTTSRARVVWQVRFQPIDREDPPALDDAWDILTASLKRGPLLRAEAKRDNEDDACIIAPDASYRGFENQLYRVEIHDSAPGKTPTYKWSRDNGSVTFPVESLSGATATVQFLGHDQRTGLSSGDWVEIVDEQSLLSDACNLVRVKRVDRSTMTVTFTEAPDVPQSAGRRILRRWERDAAPVPAAQVSPNTELFELENGVQIAFSGSGFQRGDYWLIPARTSLRDVIWKYAPPARPPHGPRHNYAPLVFWNGTAAKDLRYQFALPMGFVIGGATGTGQAVSDTANALLQAGPPIQESAAPAIQKSAAPAAARRLQRKKTRR